MRALRTPLLALLTVLLCACSSGFVYNNADWWINWYVDDYLSFNRRQQNQFDQYVDTQMLWHRDSELPRYEKFLQQVKYDVARDMSVPQVLAHFETVYGFWRDFVAQAIPAMVQVLGDIDDKQMQQLLARVEKDSKEFEAEYVRPTADEFVRDQAKRTEKSMRKWIGPLSDEQRKIIFTWATNTRQGYPASHQQRLIWQSALARALQARNDKRALKTQLERLFVTPSDMWSEPYRALMASNENHTAQMLVDLHKCLTPNQRKHLFAVIDDYMANLQQLKKNAP